LSNNISDGSHTASIRDASVRTNGCGTSYNTRSATSISPSSILTILVSSSRATKPLIRKRHIRQNWNTFLRPLYRWQGARWVRRKLATVPAAVRIVFVVAAIVMVVPLANLVYQVVRKPTELLFFFGGTLDKMPTETWRQYGPLFRTYSTGQPRFARRQGDRAPLPLGRRACAKVAACALRQRLTSDYVIACDGASSGTRETAPKHAEAQIVAINNPPLMPDSITRAVLKRSADNPVVDATRP
jgi:hypothetical protein